MPGWLAKNSISRHARTAAIIAPMPRMLRRACRKLWGRTHDGLYRPRFYALLAAGSPKQTDSSRFCSHTVQAPAKVNPLRYRSMASKPRIVRRAVWKD